MFVYNAQYADVDFKTLSDRYTNRRMVPFLTHIDGVRANLFSINPRQIMTPTMVNQHFCFCFYTVKLNVTKYVPSNTAEIRPIYLKVGHIMRKPVSVNVIYKGADPPAHPRSLISAFVVRCLDSNEILQLKAIYLDWHIHCISNLSVCGKRLIVTCTSV